MTLSSTLKWMYHYANERETEKYEETLKSFEMDGSIFFFFIYQGSINERGRGQKEFTITVLMCSLFES